MGFKHMPGWGEWSERVGFQTENSRLIFLPAEARSIQATPGNVSPILVQQANHDVICMDTERNPEKRLGTDLEQQGGLSIFVFHLAGKNNRWILSKDSWDGDLHRPWHGFQRSVRRSVNIHTARGTLHKAADFCTC